MAQIQDLSKIENALHFIYFIPFYLVLRPISNELKPKMVHSGKSLALADHCFYDFENCPKLLHKRANFQNATAPQGIIL